MTYGEDRIQKANPLQLSLFKEDLESNIKLLSANLHKLPNSSLSFITSLISHYDTKDWISDNQAIWLAGALCYINSLGTYEEQEASKVFAPNILQLFRSVGNKISFPRIRYWLESEDRLDIFPSSKTNDLLCYIYTDLFVSNNQKVYIAKISQLDALVTFSASVSELYKGFLKELFEEPVEKLKINGKKEVKCCFCGIGLENSISRAVGYGPICAGNWGLPWEKPEEDLILKL